MTLTDEQIDAPEKIWIEDDDCPYFYEESELTEVGSPVTEYTRSDLVAELEAENEWLKHALEAEKKRADEAEALAERLKREAQQHAQEARTANATITEAYQAVTGGAGEPGNWHGAEPIKAELTRLREEIEQYREAARGQLVVVNTASSRIKELESVVVKLREALKRFAEVAEWDIGDNESDSDTFHPMDPRYSVSGNISIGHLRRAHEVMEETDWVADKIRAQKAQGAAPQGEQP